MTRKYFQSFKSHLVHLHLGSPSCVWWLWCRASVVDDRCRVVDPSSCSSGGFAAASNVLWHRRDCKSDTSAPVRWRAISSLRESGADLETNAGKPIDGSTRYSRRIRGFGGWVLPKIDPKLIFSSRIAIHERKRYNEIQKMMKKLFTWRKLIKRRWKTFCLRPGRKEQGVSSCVLRLCNVSSAKTHET